MCGIAGIVSFHQPVQQSLLKCMTDVISHRGPDGEGHWISRNGNLGFGHRRLSIIDLSEHGRQPMHYAEGRYTITFNGEIYNYIELKEQLLQKGYRFVSDSDTEVLLAMYDLKKEKCLEDLNGMFAFAIWDEQEQQLFCARDRFGEKPFHYYQDEDRFVFGSEVKQLWAYGIPKKLRQERLNAFLAQGQIDDPAKVCDTFYENIQRLDAAHYMVLRPDGSTLLKKYWDLNLQAKPFSGSIESAAEEFLKLFRQSVKMRLRSDVPLGTSLSGGLDSSSICMIIDQMKGGSQKQSSFSARFKNFEKDEGKHIEAVIAACTNLEANYTWPDETYFFENFKQVSFHQDEPYTSTSIVAQFAVMQLAKEKKVTVLVDGQGADEYLAGYLPYYKLYLDQLYYNNKKQFRQEYNAYTKLQSATRPYEAPDHNESIRMKLGRYKRVLLKQPMPYGADALKKQLYADTTSMGLKTLLRYADRNSMAHSREVRLPFLDHQLVEFVFSLPDEYKLNSGWTKFVLRKAMDAILPSSICWRVDKIGYEPPQNQWLQHPSMVREIESAIKNTQGLLQEASNGNVRSVDPWRALIANYYI